MNEKAPFYISAAINCTLIILLIVGILSYQAAIRDSREIINGIEAENNELKNRLGDIQAAVDSLGAELAGSAESAGNIANGIGSVISGLDDSIRILGDLIEFVGGIEEILNGGTPESP